MLTLICLFFGAMILFASFLNDNICLLIVGILLMLISFESRIYIKDSVKQQNTETHIEECINSGYRTYLNGNEINIDTVLLSDTKSHSMMKSKSSFFQKDN